MPRRRKVWTPKKARRFHREGRGQGVLGSYRPWVGSTDFHSVGRQTRALGWKTGRLHTFFSDLETNLFYLLEWDASVIDIREQFPLRNVALARTIASQIGMRYPGFISKGRYLTMTTDFMVTFRCGAGYRNIAYSVKHVDSLHRITVTRRLELERCYWNAHGIDWHLVIDTDFPLIVINNIAWLHQAYDLRHVLPTGVDYNRPIATLIDSLSDGARSINRMLRDIEAEYCLPNGSALNLLRHLIARKVIHIDMAKLFDPRDSVSVLGHAAGQSHEI